MSTSVATNGSARKPRTAEFFYNELMFAHHLHVNEVRTLLSSRTSGLNPPNRDIDLECGYKQTPTVEDFKEIYRRGDIGKTVIDIWADECWAAYPEIYETEDAEDTPWEKAWAELAKRTNPWHYLHRVDRMSGIGRYGVLFLGLDDGADFAEPASTYNRDGTRRANARNSNLMYIRAFGEDTATVDSFEENKGNPRYGQPTFYSINFANPQSLKGVPSGSGFPFKTDKVHWTRVVHVADNCGDSEIFGAPRAECVFNRLMDVRKVAGSSAEMFYKGGFPGYQYKTLPDLIGGEQLTKEEVRDEVEAYQNGLQRFLTAINGEWASLAPQVADPSKNLIQQLTLISAAIRVPLRILLGTESGHLASTQDAGTWKERLRGRQLNYLEPRVVRPFVDRLMDLGALPRTENYFISWRDLKTLGDKDQAEVGLKKTQAFMQYVSGKVYLILPPRLFMTHVIGLTDAQAAAVIKELGGDEAAKKKLEDMAKQEREAKTQGGGRVGGPNRNNPGKPAGPPRSNR